ncbi:hypothetical protein BgAZ_302320 [Babesia gibsoni]|uniref:DNA-directed RNA polymerase III subunit RPC3 n=1 Tax=Babesia gibsoni TaxID=33632 RepID=A0AAD8PDF4_BABGI|nr:hypothetical protein BgAZ_302320 [Babesia gibsoni]
MYSTEYELVVRLLELYFGRQVAKVGGYILLRGQVSLQKLMTQGHFDFKVLRNSIVILLHYGFLDYTVQFIQYGNRRTGIVLYFLRCQKVLSYPLIPFGLLLAKSELGSECYEMLMLLAKYGTISHRCLCELAATTFSATVAETEKVIKRLRESRFIEKCDSYQHRVMVLEVNSRNKDSANDPLAAMNAEIFHVMQGAELVGPDGELLRLNSDLIEIVNLICRRVGDMPIVRAIMKALMENPKGKWPMLVDFPVLKEQVLKILQNSFGQKSTGEQVLRLLNALNKHPDNLVQHEDLTNSYHLAWHSAKRMLRKKAILGCVRQQCGPKAARVWNLLVSENEDGGHATFDAHKVSAKALVSVQTARSILYQLTLRGLASHHETDAVSNTLPTTTTSERHMLTFSSDMESTYLQLLKTAFRFASNLLERLDYEKRRIFQSYVKGTAVTCEEGGNNNKECDIVEAHFLHVIKFVVLMQKL